MKKYKFLGTSSGDKFIIRGINVYKYKWSMDGECVIVIDPTDNKPKSFSVYQIDIGSKKLKFICGELSNGEKGFYEFE
ncbi:MAG: hypothetical protein ACI4I4_07210 [Acutalibacteraceae bacterium]